MRGWCWPGPGAPRETCPRRRTSFSWVFVRWRTAMAPITREHWKRRPWPTPWIGSHLKASQPARPLTLPQQPMQQEARLPPVTLYRPLRNAPESGDLSKGKPSEEVHINELSQRWVHCGELVQRVTQLV